MPRFYGTSETLRNETVGLQLAERVQPISVHIPKHLKPVSDEQFGHYLAGLIDGNGHFSSKQELVIVFDLLDASLAFYIKKRLSYGSIKKVKDKNAFLLVIAAKKGLEKVIELINGKIRTENKFNQINNKILNHDSYAEFKKTINLKLNYNKDFKNHWLAGFSDADADASFQIKVIKPKAVNLNSRTADGNADRVELKLNYEICAPQQALRDKDNILLLIKDFLGGNIGYIKSQDTYSYCSSSYGSARKIIGYFDYFHLLSSKHINYLKWRKAYLIIQAHSGKIYLNKEGLEKIIKLKNSMNKRPHLLGLQHHCLSWEGDQGHCPLPHPHSSVYCSAAPQLALRDKGQRSGGKRETTV